MSQFQNIVASRLAQGAIPATVTNIISFYISPTNNPQATNQVTPTTVQTYLKDMDICNTTSSSISVYIFIVQNGSTAVANGNGIYTGGVYNGLGNALFYNTPIPANSVVQWTGTQILNPGDSIQGFATATGCVLTISGAQAT
jgi:hypothetical protein